VVGVITAFNFPVAVWAWNALLAAVCGNATVWKPSPKTPLAAIAVQQLCNQIIVELGLPPIFTLLIDAGRDAGARLAADSRVALLSFTGSSAVGRQIAQVVAGRFGRCLLECSGNNAIIVAEDADLDLVIPAVVFGAVGTAGQRCTTTRRLLVHESIEPEVVRRLEAAYAQVPIGDPLEPSTLMGPLIDAAAVAAFLRAVEEARAAGGAVVCGGNASGGPGFFVEPAIVRNARNDWPVVQRETFAPILYVIRCRDLQEAISLHNAVPPRCRSLSVGYRQRLRHRQRQPWDVGRRDRRRVRRREGNRRRTRGGIGCMAGLHAPPDQHDQLEPRAPARSRHQVRWHLRRHPGALEAKRRACAVQLSRQAWRSSPAWHSWFCQPWPRGARQPRPASPHRRGPCRAAWR
jgi:delta 1-pyrroline-5-carboxylate dehydrogenase